MGNWRNRGPVPPDTICVSCFSLFGMEHKRPSCSKRWVPTTKCMKAPNRTSSSPSGNALAAGAKDHGSSRAAVRTRGNGVRFRVKGASERLKENRERAHRLTPNPKARPHPMYFVKGRKTTHGRSSFLFFRRRISTETTGVFLTARIRRLHTRRLDFGAIVRTSCRRVRSALAIPMLNTGLDISKIEAFLT